MGRIYTQLLHGLKFLRGELSIERDWDVLYINRDKLNGLPPNPIQQLIEGIPIEFSLEENKWNWGNCKVLNLFLHL